MGRSVPIGGGSGVCNRQVEGRQAGESGRLLRGRGCWGGPLEEEEGGQGALEAAQLRDTASPGARPPRSEPPPRPAQPGHSWPGPRTPMGRPAPPPPRPPSQTWCPGRCRARPTTVPPWPWDQGRFCPLGGAPSCTLNPGPKRGCGAPPAKLSATRPLKADRLPIGRGRGSPARRARR